MRAMLVFGLFAACGDSGGVPVDGASDGSGADGPRNACGKTRPGPTTTGVPAGTVLTPSGSIRVEQDGAIVEDLDIAGEIHVLANDVTIRRVRVRSGDYYPIRYFDDDPTGLVIEDSEIEGTSDDATSSIAFANYTLRRVNIHGAADGIKADANVLIEESWIHDLRNGPDQHNDGVQSTGGANVVLRNNWITGGSNAAVQAGDEGAAVEGLTIECNWLGGGGYTLNIRGEGATVPRGTRIVDNVFTKDAGYGPWTLDDPAPTIQRNTYEDGEVIPDDRR